jgi:hypothetical protein
MKYCDHGYGFGVCFRLESDDPTPNNGSLWIVRCPGEEIVMNGQVFGGDSCSSVCATDADDARARLDQIRSAGGSGSFSTAGCAFVDSSMSQGTCTIGVFPELGTPEFDYEQALCDQYVFND